MSMRRFAAPLAAFALTSGLVLAGCQLFPGGAGNPSPSPSASSSTETIPAADLEACEHMNNGPSVAVTAAKLAKDAPEVNERHKRYDITLLADNAQFEGKVLYNSGEEAHYVFFFDQNVTLEVRDDKDAVVEHEAVASFSVACGKVKARYEVPLGVGRYTLQLGPTAAATVSLVVEETAHEDHDHAH